MNEKTITATELCTWLQFDGETLRDLRRRRTATHFPPPTLAGEGLSWWEADIVSWISWLHERNEWVESGLDPAGLPAPEYMAAEPGIKPVEQKP